MIKNTSVQFYFSLLTLMAQAKTTFCTGSSWAGVTFSPAAHTAPLLEARAAGSVAQHTAFRCPQDQQARNSGNTGTTADPKWPEGHLILCDAALSKERRKSCSALYEDVSSKHLLHAWGHGSQDRWLGIICWYEVENNFSPFTSVWILLPFH